MAEKPTYKELERRIQELEQAEAESERTREALRESKQIIEGIINAIPVRVFWKDQDLVFLGCNALFASDAGFDNPRDVIGKDDYQMVWLDQAESYRSDDLEVIASGEAKLLIEESQTTPNGETITLLTSKIPLRSSSGEIKGVLGTYMDITVRKQAEERIRQSEEKFRILFESSKDASYISTQKGNIIETNQSFLDLFGYSKGDIGDFVFPERYVNPIDRSRFMEKIEKNGFVKDFAVEFSKNDGTPMDCLVTATISRSKDGSSAKYQGIIRDITEHNKKQAEREKLITDLQAALAEVKTLTGLLPICSLCSKIKDDNGYWNRIEAYIQKHSYAQFSHSICKECAQKHYPGIKIYDD